jgi:hypothetical protein
MSDLVPIFLDYLDGFEGFTDLIVETEATFNHMIDLEQEKSYWKNEEWIKASDYLNYLVYERVFDALNNVSPQGFYFGASEGDGACFGFWKAEEEEF